MVLPQIIGCKDDISFERAEAIFSKLTADILKTEFISAELVKLFNNVSRYVHFATANHFMLVAEHFKENVYELIDMANYKYPRGIIAQPGFTAGTCLRKDFGMLNECFYSTDLLLSSWKINEFMPKFLVDSILKRTSISGKIIAVLGYTFKMDTDDTRDSLVPKLIRYIEREVPKSIVIHDPFLGINIDELYTNANLEDTVADADIIFIGAGHSYYRENFNRILDLCKTESYFVDIWNVSQLKQTFFQKKDCKI